MVRLYLPRSMWFVLGCIVGWLIATGSYDIEGVLRVLSLGRW